MDKEYIEKKIFQKYGDIPYELLKWGNYNEPITYKCLKCGKITTLYAPQQLWPKQKKRFCTCYTLENNNSRIPIEESQRRLDEYFYGEYIILKKNYKGWSQKSLIKHQKCGKIFNVQPRRLLVNAHCPCQQIKSKGEQLIQLFLENNDIVFESQKRIEGLPYSPFDFYLPKYNLLIEFQGRQHFEPVEKFGGKEQFKLQQEIDSRKKEIALSKGYEVFYISYKNLSFIKEILVQRLFP